MTDNDDVIEGAESRLPADPEYWDALATRIQHDGRERVSAMGREAHGWLSLAERYVGALVAAAAAATIVLIVQNTLTPGAAPSFASTLTPPEVTVAATGHAVMSAPHLESILLHTGGTTHDDR